MRRFILNSAASILVGVSLLLSPNSVGNSAVEARGLWGWPLEGSHRIVRPYLAPETPYGRGHRGVDLAADSSTIVLAPENATVWFSGRVVDRELISLRLTDGTLLSFEPVHSSLRAGDRVERGQQIGTLLDGHCTPACLHFGVRVHGEYVSPLLFLGGIPHSVLLPTRELP
ncbi:MAG: M23 family metallopeptidase [Cryobacterium sp.]|nr:M23 family metallopeptidase [Cryobacterium sp.]MBX3115735.1 M23 family metallopeptidase [Cryobacterium sp.]MCO5294404.1 M23 family metallopeptidase [Homoserinimonas sp.]